MDFVQEYGNQFTNGPGNKAKFPGAFEENGLYAGNCPVPGNPGTVHHEMTTWIDDDLVLPVHKNPAWITPIRIHYADMIEQILWAFRCPVFRHVVWRGHDTTGVRVKLAHFQGRVLGCANSKGQVKPVGGQVHIGIIQP